MLKVSLGRFEIDFEYEYTDGKTEEMVFMEPTDQIFNDPFKGEKKETNLVKASDMFAGILKQCVKCKDFDAFIQDVCSKSTAEQLFGLLREELGKQKTKA